MNELTTAYPEQELGPSAEYDDQYDEGTGGSDGEDAADKDDGAKVGNETKNNVMQDTNLNAHRKSAPTNNLKIVNI